MICQEAKFRKFGFSIAKVPTLSLIDTHTHQSFRKWSVRVRLTHITGPFIEGIIPRPDNQFAVLVGDAILFTLSGIVVFEPHTTGSRFALTI